MAAGGRAVPPVASRALTGDETSGSPVGTAAAAGARFRGLAVTFAGVPCEISAIGAWPERAAGALRFSRTSPVPVPEVGSRSGSEATDVEIAVRDAASAEPRSPPAIAGDGRENRGATTAALLVETAVSRAVKTAVTTEGHSAAFGCDDAGGALKTGAIGATVAGIPRLVTSVGATAPDASAGVFASTGTAADAAGISAARGRLPVRPGCEPVATLDFVLPALAGTGLGSAIVVGASPETGGVAAAGGNATGVCGLVSGTGDATKEAGTFCPGKTGCVLRSVTTGLVVASANTALATTVVGRVTGTEISGTDKGAAGDVDTVVGTVGVLSSMGEGGVAAITSAEFNSVVGRSELSSRRSPANGGRSESWVEIACTSTGSVPWVCCQGKPASAAVVGSGNWLRGSVEFAGTISSGATGATSTTGIWAGENVVSGCVETGCPPVVDDRAAGADAGTIAAGLIATIPGWGGTEIAATRVAGVGTSGVFDSGLAVGAGATMVGRTAALGSATTAGTVLATSDGAPIRGNSGCAD